MCQGIAYESWAVAEFPHLKEKVVSSLEGRAEEQEVSAVEAEAISTRLREMFTAIHTKKGSKSLASEGVVKPIGLPSESESPKTNLVQEIPETPKASHDRKRRNSLDSTRGLSPRNSKSLSELRSSMCNLEAELIEMRNNLVIYIQRTDTYEEHISLLEDKLVQQDNNNKVGLKQLASRVVDLEVENNALKADNAKLKADFQVLKKVSKQSKKEICMKDQGIQSDKENVVIIEQPSEVPTEVFDIPSHPNQFEVLKYRIQIPLQIKAHVARHCFVIRDRDQKQDWKAGVELTINPLFETKNGKVLYFSLTLMRNTLTLTSYREIKRFSMSSALRSGAQ